MDDSSDTSMPPETRPNKSATDITSGKTEVLGLDYNTAALLCYLPVCAINLIASIVFLKTESKDNRFIRFHAVQSLVMCAAYVALGVGVSIVTTILGFIPILGAMISMLVWLVWLIATILFLWKSISCMIDAHKGQMNKVEYIGDFAEQYL